MQIHNRRVQNPTDIDEAAIMAALADGHNLTLQFSEAAAYAGDILDKVDDLCARCDDRLHVRFYGHYNGFDARTVMRLPHVKHLLIECGDGTQNFDVLWQLPHLEALSLSIFKLKTPDILAGGNFSRLRKLRLGPTKADIIDLGPVGEMKELRELSIHGHTRNIDAVGTSQNIERMRLHLGKNVRLGFVNSMGGLRRLSLFLGGRDDIDEIEGAGIEALEIERVRGFCRFGHLDRWHDLQTLMIEDQIKLPELTFSAAMKSLKHIRIINCKTLSRLNNIRDLPAVENVRIFSTALDFDKLCAAGLPISLRQLAFWTSSNKRNGMIEQKIAQMGYGTEPPFIRW